MRQVGLSTMSGRPRLAIGTYGTITTTELPGGQWDAKTRYRDHDGKTRQLRARGTTARTYCGIGSDKCANCGVGRSRS